MGCVCLPQMGNPVWELPGKGLRNRKDGGAGRVGSEGETGM